jgi:hypothetical protein
MAAVTRRQFVASASSVAAGLAGSATTSACGPSAEAESYEAAVARTWRGGSGDLSESRALRLELVRYATLAPSSHNTQCWKFGVAHDAITILPDLQRRCPVVDPDDHHLFVSLGCAAENLVQAASAHGLAAEPNFNTATGAIRMPLVTTGSKASALISPLFPALAARQCTRGDYDSKPLTKEELALLERAGSSSGVRLLLLTERPAMERVLEVVVQANTAQMADAAFVKELRSWIRFNGAEAVRARDGLFSVSSGNPELPTWLGDLVFGWVFTPKGENEKLVRQIRSSAGLAVFIGLAAEPAHWVEVGRCYERFALQATALGIRNAFLNQPVEVAAVRPVLAQALGLTPGQRPDLVVRFGRGPTLPPSLRRPVQAVLV